MRPPLTSEELSRPQGALLSGTSAVVVAVLCGAHTVREVARRTGDSVANAHHHLTHARRLGLVRWDEGKASTLRPGVGVAAHTPER